MLGASTIGDRQGCACVTRVQYIPYSINQLPPGFKCGVTQGLVRLIACLACGLLSYM